MCINNHVFALQMQYVQFTSLSNPVLTSSLMNWGDIIITGCLLGNDDDYCDDIDDDVDYNRNC